jgi:hypothetical protein
MTAKRTAWAAFLVAAALIVAVHFLRTPLPAPDAAAEQQQSETVQGPQSGVAGSGSPTPGSEVDRSNGFAQPFPDHAQAPETAGPRQYERQTIAPPSVPEPDENDPAAVAEAFLTVYNTRSAETDKSWQETVPQWLTPDLAQQLPGVSNGALEGKAPTAVSAVAIKGNVEDWGPDTPLRWAHHADVTMYTQDNGTYVLAFRVRSQLTDQGWLINAVPLDSWHRIGT